MINSDCSVQPDSASLIMLKHMFSIFIQCSMYIPHYNITVLTSYSGPILPKLAYNCQYRLCHYYSQAGTVPFATTLISDYFAENHRTLAISVFNSGAYFGLGLSYAFGNFVTESLVCIGFLYIVDCVYLLSHNITPSQRSDNDRQLFIYKYVQ